MNQPHIVVSRDNHQLSSFPIEKDAIFIGRKSDNDICLNSLSVSGHHSKIVSIIDSFFLEDLNSTNGTFVNTKPIKKYVLQNGDVIQIGNHRLEFVAPENIKNETDKPIDNDVLEQTIVLTAEELSQSVDQFNAMPPTEKQTTTSSSTDTSEFYAQKKAAQPEGKLQILEGKHAGVVIDLTKSLTTFGAPGTSIAGVTKRTNSYYLIRVQGLEDSVRINGENTLATATPLEEHDIIEVANTKLEFYLEQSS